MSSFSAYKSLVQFTTELNQVSRGASVYNVCDFAYSSVCKLRTEAQSWTDSGKVELITLSNKVHDIFGQGDNKASELLSSFGATSTALGALVSAVNPAIGGLLSAIGGMLGFFGSHADKTQEKVEKSFETIEDRVASKL